jgi:RND superfamily putative drug exporter
MGGVIVRWPWAVIAFWIALAAVLSLTMPSLEVVSQRRPVSILPSNAPALVTNRQMTAAFHESGLQSILVVVLTDERGLSPADETVYRKLVDTLRQDKRDVVMMQDFLAAPPLRDLMTSKDKKSWILPVGLPGDLGSKESKQANINVSEIVKHTLAGSRLTANLTGPAATVGDLNVIGQRDRLRIEFAITILLFVILLIIYRNPITMALPMITIGISVLVAQRVVAVVGLMGLGIANQTIIFMSGMMVGAGTDYAVFLISRYHDYVRCGAERSGRQSADIHRQGDRRVRGHRGHHVSRDDLHPSGNSQDCRPGAGDLDRGGLLRGGDVVAGVDCHCRAPRLDRAA